MYAGGQSAITNICGGEVVEWSSKGFGLHALNSERRETMRVGDLCMSAEMSQHV